MIQKKATHQLFKNLDRMEYGSLNVTTPDGQTRSFGGHKSGEHANIELRDWRVLRNMLLRGDIAFAEDYRAGLWETDNLSALTTIGLKNRSALDRFVAGNSLFRVISSFSYLTRLNTLSGSRKNIHEHYDLGNGFYKLWLDPSMTYSSGIYDSTGDILKAQHNKYDRILKRLGQNDGDILEIGCGWGGFAERAIERGFKNIKGITLSEEQYSFAKERLGEKANIALEDYRDQDGKFQNIVSIEMFEAVGERFWPVYFDKIKALLADNGRAVIQTITINEQDFPRYRTGGDFIRSYIFPGGMLPSPTRFYEEAEKAGLKVNDSFRFGHDYARTLDMWLENFEEKIGNIRAMGYDEGFIRLWRLYLASCAAGFRTNKTDVMQVELRHA